ncbi:MAG: asparagine synthase (glutamine-hydrolyzing) [Myxococcota bacterium]
MCGIYGVLHAGGDEAAVLVEMDQLLAHRGPDGAGLTRVRSGALGHRRLSIRDLSPNGAQPMWDASGRACVVYNGEIYNHRELRAECERAGLTFRSTSDTEVILSQYVLHGEAAFSRLNGIFAFCLWDADTGVAYLVRDPLGVKPLYYAPTSRGLYFASELKALTHSGAVAPQVDHAALRTYLQLDYVPSPLCLVRGVSKLRAGHLLAVHPDGRQEMRCFSTLEDAARLPTEDPQGAFADVIRSAVERQLVADVPVGVFLSGGLDSSIIAQTATEVLGQPVESFSISFEDPSFDESEHFQCVAKAIGSRQHTRVVRAADLLELLPRLPRLVCEPVADGSIFPTYLLCRFAAEHVKVVLSGDGADELFAGYPTHVAGMLAEPLRALPRTLTRLLARAAHAGIPVSLDNLSRDYRLKKFLTGLARDPLVRNARWLGTFMPEQVDTLLVEPTRDTFPLERLLHDEVRVPAQVSLLERLLRMDQRFYLQDQVLVKVDRASMANSLEVRVPFLDHEVVRFSRALPARFKLRGLESKHLLRRHAAARLPPSIAARGKKGFGTPLARWFQRELREVLHDTLSPRVLARHGLLRPGPVQALLDAHQAGRRDHRKELFNLLTLTLWLEDMRNVARPAPRAPVEVVGAGGSRWG